VREGEAKEEEEEEELEAAAALLEAIALSFFGLLRLVQS